MAVAETVARWLAGPPASTILRSRLRADGDLAYPTDPPIAHGSGPDPDRVLLVGSPVAGGAGVASHDLALCGWLARRLAALTGRGADVEVRVADPFDLQAAAAILRTENLDRFDAVLVMVGVRHVLRMLPDSLWRREVQAFLDVATADVPPTLPILLAGTSQFALAMDVPAFAVRWAERIVIAHNEVTRRSCEASGRVRYLPFAPERAGIRPGMDAAAIYDNWSTALAPVLAELLTAEHAGGRTVPTGFDDAARQRALDALGVADVPTDPRIEQIVRMARAMLGLESALTVVDGDMLRVIFAASSRVRTLPRAQTFCNYQIAHPGVLIVPDVASHPLFGPLAHVEGREHVGFYAGYPLEAPGGERIGALAVYADHPREFTAEETSLLRDLALRAQAVLWDQGST
ncbi:MAG: GAF domain-containing protein [Microbacteriaceae bacterium]|nr:GAF domain-containing protein [Microbacteriaceae bacterium]